MSWHSFISDSENGWKKGFNLSCYFVKLWKLGGKKGEGSRSKDSCKVSLNSSSPWSSYMRDGSWKRQFAAYFSPDDGGQKETI